MRKPVLITTIALAVVLALFIAIYAVTRPAKAPAGDKLVRQSYTDGEYSQALIKSVSSSVDTVLKPLYDAALETTLSAKAASSAPSRHTVSKDGSVELSEGASITMVSGEADISVSAGKVSDVTAGVPASNGGLATAHRYIVCTGGKAAVSVSQRSVFIISGSAGVTAGEIAAVSFADVKAGAWYYDSVSYLAGIGLLGGVSNTAFAPNGTMTVAQAITLAASLHQYGENGKVTLKADEDIWYMSYVEYAVSERIVDGSYAAKTTAEYASPVTRAEFVHIMYKALTEDGYKVINSVADGSIPDVKMTDDYADEIYSFYRSGIITGDKTHKFNPSGTIKRGEVAAIAANMLDPTLRQPVTLK